MNTLRNLAIGTSIVALLGGAGCHSDGLTSKSKENMTRKAFVAEAAKHAVKTKPQRTPIPSSADQEALTQEISSLRKQRKANNAIAQSMEDEKAHMGYAANYIAVRGTVNGGSDPVLQSRLQALYGTPTGVQTPTPTPTPIVPANPTPVLHTLYGKVLEQTVAGEGTASGFNIYTLLLSNSKAQYGCAFRFIGDIAVEEGLNDEEAYGAMKTQFLHEIDLSKYARRSGATVKVTGTYPYENKCLQIESIEMK